MSRLQPAPLALFTVIAISACGPSPGPVSAQTPSPTPSSTPSAESGNVILTGHLAILHNSSRAVAIASNEGGHLARLVARASGLEKWDRGTSGLKARGVTLQSNSGGAAAIAIDFPQGEAWEVTISDGLTPTITNNATTALLMAQLSSRAKLTAKYASEDAADTGLSNAVRLHLKAAGATFVDHGVTHDFLAAKFKCTSADAECQIQAGKSLTDRIRWSAPKKFRVTIKSGKKEASLTFVDHAVVWFTNEATDVAFPPAGAEITHLKHYFDFFSGYSSKYTLMRQPEAGPVFCPPVLAQF